MAVAPSEQSIERLREGASRLRQLYSGGSSEDHFAMETLERHARELDEQAEKWENQRRDAE